MTFVFDKVSLFAVHVLMYLFLYLKHSHLCTGLYQKNCMFLAENWFLFRKSTVSTVFI